MFSRQGVCSRCKEYTGISIHPEGFGQGYSSGTGATSNTDWACQGYERNVGCTQIVKTELSTFCPCFLRQDSRVELPWCCVIAKDSSYFNAFREALGQGVGDVLRQEKIVNLRSCSGKTHPRTACGTDIFIVFDCYLCSGKIELHSRLGARRSVLRMMSAMWVFDIS